MYVAKLKIFNALANTLNNKTIYDICTFSWQENQDENNDDKIIGYKVSKQEKISEPCTFFEFQIS